MNLRGKEITLIDELPSTRFVIDNIATWEKDTFDTVDRYVRGGVFVDIGAWCGVVSLYASHLASHVISVEPDPVAFSLLERNIAANGITNITPVNAAVWDVAGTTTLFAHEEGFGSSMTGPSRNGLAMQCRTITPESVRFMAEVHGRIDLVKVDTEGSETHIVPGLLDWAVPVHLSLHVNEMDGPINYRGRKVQKLVDHPHYPVVVLP